MPRIGTAAALACALALAGCGRSGYGTVDEHQLVLIPTAQPTDAALICGARAEAARLHRALRVQRPRNPSPSAQIAVTNAVTAEKPGGVVIVPVAADPMLAPILSMRRAGIAVVRLRRRPTPATAAAEGARAVAEAVRGIERGHGPLAVGEAGRLPAPCDSVH